MQSFIVVASLLSELAGGQNDPPLVLNVTKKHLSPLRVNVRKVPGQNPPDRSPQDIYPRQKPPDKKPQYKPPRQNPQSKILCLIF